MTKFSRPKIRAAVACGCILLCLPNAFAADSDNDGLLDVIDVPGYNTSATGTLVLNGLGIEDLDGVRELSPNLRKLYLGGNQITRIEAGDLTGLNTTHLYFYDNQITEIEPHAFAGLTLRDLNLNNNRFSDLHLEGGIYEVLFHLGIDRFDVKRLFLDEAQISAFSLEEVARETTEITDLSMVGTTFLGDPPATLQDILEAESLENVMVDQALFDMYAEDFNRFAAMAGNRLSIIDLTVKENAADCNASGALDFEDLHCVETLTQRDDVLTELGLRPGDLNGDGVVVFSDFLIFVREFGLSDRSYLQGNLDLEGTVAFEDFLILAEHFGSVPSNATESTAIPEPHTFALLGMSLVFLPRFRKPRRPRYGPRH